MIAKNVQKAMGIEQGKFMNKPANIWEASCPAFDGAQLPRGQDGYCSSEGHMGTTTEGYSFTVDAGNATIRDFCKLQKTQVLPPSGKVGRMPKSGNSDTAIVLKFNADEDSPGCTDYIAEGYIKPRACLDGFTMAMNDCEPQSDRHINPY